MDTVLIRVEPWRNGTKRLRVVRPLSVEVYSDGSWAAHLPVNGGDAAVIDGATEVHVNGWVPLHMIAEVLNAHDCKVVEELLPFAVSRSGTGYEAPILDGMPEQSAEKTRKPPAKVK
tara:strand:- start:140 stop:490 length:351 start_codon:yes stop_codon:yes gene_type:complete